jgi:hypothetical protein
MYRCQGEGYDDDSADYRYDDHRAPPSSTAVIDEGASLLRWLKT